MPNSLQYPTERQRDLQWKWGRPLLFTAASTCAPMNTQVDADGAGLLLDALVDTRRSQDLNDDSPRDHRQMDEEDDEDGDDEDDDGDDDEDEEEDEEEDEDDGDDEEDDDNGDDDEDDDGDEEDEDEVEDE